MKLEEFRALVYEHFGNDLRRATPANVREFLCTFDKPKGVNGRLELKEKHTTLESIYRDFFANVLEMPKDEALILLWTFGLEFAFGMVEDHLSDQMTTLFKGLDE